MPADRSYVEKNTRERERLRAVVGRLSDDDLRRKVNEHWTVAATLAHAAFWDARTVWLVDKLERGEAFSPADVEPDDVTWVNDSMLRLIDAIPGREAARLALRLAEEADRRVAAADPARMWPTDAKSLINPLRAEHRREHLDQIEAALRPGSGT